MRHVNSSLILGFLFLICVASTNASGSDIYSPDGPTLIGIEDIMVAVSVSSDYSFYSESQLQTMIERELQDAGISIIDEHRDKISGFLSLYISVAGSKVNGNLIGYAVSHRLDFRRYAVMPPDKNRPKAMTIYPIVWIEAGVFIVSSDENRDFTRRVITDVVESFIVDFRKAKNLNE